jgi:hypothetical protein
LKLDLPLQASGAVLVKSILNDQVTSTSRAISWLTSTGTGLGMDGSGFKGGFAIAENGTLLETGGQYINTPTATAATTYYIDPSASVNGNGTMQSPFNSFFKLPVLTGDLNGTQILFKRGTKWRGYVELKGCTNFTIDAYGTGALPIVDASDIFTNWKQEGNTWYLENRTQAQSVFVNNNRLVGVASKNEMSANANTAWFDAGSSRIYINCGNTVNPNNTTVELTARTHGMYLLNCSNFTIRNMHLQKARNCGVFIWGK